MTGVGLAWRWRAAPDGLQPFQPGRDLRAVIDLLESGFGADLEARDRRWLADLSALSGTGPLAGWVMRFFPYADSAFKGYVWYAGGRLVGNASVIHSSDDLWIIANVVTHPDYRRRGIARDLMDAAIEAAQARGARQIQLQVRADNAAALRLYDRLGFWRMNAATLLRLPSPRDAQRLGRPATGWTMIRLGRSTQARARRLLTRIGEIDRGGPTSLAVQAAESGSLLDRLDDWMQGRSRYAWAATAGGELRGLIAAHGMRWQGPHRLDLVVDPAWAGRVEAPLTDVALAALARHARFEIEAEVDAGRTTVIDTLIQAGFRGARTLERLALDLD